MTESESAPASRSESVPVVSKQKRKGCGCWTILLTAFLVLVVAPVVLLVVTFVWLRISDSYALESELDLAREAGYPLTLQEIEAAYPTSPEIEEATAHWQKAIEIVSSEEYRQAAVGVPFVDFGEEAKDEPVLPLTGERLDLARMFVQSQRLVLEEVRAARDAGSVARFPVKFEELIYIDLSHAQGLRDIVHLLRLDAEIRLAENDSFEASEDLLSLIATQEALANEPIALSQLSRVFCLDQALTAIGRLLSRSEPSDEQLARLDAAFARAEPLKGFRHGLKDEFYKARYLTRYDSPIDDPRVEASALHLFSDADHAKFLRFARMYDEATQAEVRNRGEAIGVVDEEMVEVCDSRFSFLRYPVTCATSMHFALYCASQRAEASAAVSRVAIAVERYRSANGVPPETLDRLVPRFLKAVPLDPYDGQPIRYRVQGDASPNSAGLASAQEPVHERNGRKLPPPPPSEAGVLVYSIGPNVRDDGGSDDAVGGDVILFIPDGEDGADAKAAQD